MQTIIIIKLGNVTANCQLIVDIFYLVFKVNVRNLLHQKKNILFLFQFFVRYLCTNYQTTKYKVKIKISLIWKGIILHNSSVYPL